MPECQKKTKNGGLDQYGPKRFGVEPFGVAGLEMVKIQSFSYCFRDRKAWVRARKLRLKATARHRCGGVVRCTVQR